ncbi:hypothetical protein B484DRAFT_409627 [Ochromonadaceae sp. CCMP2298]|nr:hypothetical protein B484DRAFT_409627 [Ochromonadaceae sp. CCMP2298]
MSQLIGAAVGTLNAVDCTVPSPCAPLHRRTCQATAGTCGPCLGGYLGLSGDSNIACQPLHLRQRLRYTSVRRR